MRPEEFLGLQGIGASPTVFRVSNKVIILLNQIIPTVLGISLKSIETIEEEPELVHEGF